MKRLLLIVLLLVVSCSPTSDLDGTISAELRYSGFDKEGNSWYHVIETDETIVLSSMIRVDTRSLNPPRDREFIAKLEVTDGTYFIMRSFR